MSATAQPASLPPALPWAAAAAAPEREKEFIALPLAQIGLALGHRIEVKWELNDDDGDDGDDGEQAGGAAKEEPKAGEPRVRWWGATVHAAAPERDGAAAAGAAFALRYDAAEGFEEEAAHVQFLSDHYLQDLGEGAPLAWRREGDAWEEPLEASDSDDDDDGAAAAADGPDDAAAVGDGSAAAMTVTLGSKEVAGRMRAVDAKVAAAMETLDAAGQRVLAQGVADVADALRAFVRARAEEAPSGGEVVIDAAAVASFVSEMQSKRAEQRERLGLAP